MIPFPSQFSRHLGGRQTRLQQHKIKMEPVSTGPSPRLKKPITALLLSFALLFSCTACSKSKKPDQQTGTAEQSQSAASEQPPSVNPLNSIKFEPQTIPPSALTAQAAENWSRWPAVSTAPYKMHLDMDLYQTPDRLPLPLTGITVIVDAGHGGPDPGAISTAEDGSQVYEKDLNLQIAGRIKPRLEALGAKVLMTRTDDSWVSLYRRVAIGANASLMQWLSAGQAAGLDTGFINPLLEQLQKVYDINNDDLETGGRGMFTGLGVNSDVRLLFDLEKQTPNIIYLSVHCNSTAENQSDSRGCFVYYCTNDSIFGNELMTLNTGITEDIEPLNPNYTGYDDEARIRLASSVQAGVVGAVPELHNPDMPPIHTGNFAFIRESNLPAVLLECGYMSHAGDLALLCDPATQDRIADGAAQGIKSYFNPAQNDPSSQTGGNGGTSESTQSPAPAASGTPSPAAPAPAAVPSDIPPA